MVCSITKRQWSQLGRYLTSEGGGAVIFQDHVERQEPRRIHFVDDNHLACLRCECKASTITLYASNVPSARGGAGMWLSVRAVFHAEYFIPGANLVLDKSGTCMNKASMFS